MRFNARSIATAAMLVVAASAFASIQANPLVGSMPGQSSPNTPDITDKECAFWLDHNGDGKGDDRLSGEYILQETPVVGGCDFKLSAPEVATIIVESELTDWEAEVEIKREPGPSEGFKIYPGRAEIPGMDGRMRVIVNFVAGDTPRSEKSRVLQDGYRHEVQIPDEFRILEVTVTTADGSKDWLAKNAQAASSEYIRVHRIISERQGEVPEEIVTLAKEWMAEGYPQVAASIIELDTDSAAGVGSWWKWAAGAIVGVIIIAIVGTIYWVFLRTPPAPTIDI